MYSSTFFEVSTPLGFRVRTSVDHWGRILAKHEDMNGREDDVMAALTSPDEVRRSIHDPDVYLFYIQESQRRYLCALGKPVADYGILVTAYPTDRIKEGERVWPR